MDLHEDVHRAIENYLDENEFRRWLNSAIQNSRAVTFLLQKRKAKWAEFDEWYGAWQTEARANRVLTWGVNSRNRIVKEEDLRTLSQAIISYYGERLREAEGVLIVPPHTTVEEMAHAFVSLTKAKPSGRKGWIRIQRRWVDDQLPDFELVAALREMYASVAEVVERAHVESRVVSCLAPNFRRPCVVADIDPSLHCIGSGEVLPSRLIDAETGELASIERVTVMRDEDAGQAAAERYGFTPKLDGGPIEHALQRLEASKRFLEKDGFSVPMLLLFRGSKEVRVQTVVFEEDNPRELMIAAAVEAEGAWQFDGAVWASETWIASPHRGALVGARTEDLLPSDDEFFDADRIGNRDEALYVVALAKDGRTRTLTLPFGRTRAGIIYGQLQDDVSGKDLPLLLRPIWARWSGKRAWKPTTGST